MLGMETMVVVGVLFMKNVQVDEYWSIKERDNFAKYCHPMQGCDLEVGKIMYPRITTLMSKKLKIMYIFKKIMN